MKLKILAATFIFIFLILFIDVISKSIVVAADKAKCDQYANEAVAQQITNIKKGCGFESPAWHDDYDLHYQWCLSAKPESVDKANADRKEKLDQCLFPKMKPPPQGYIPPKIPKPEFKTKEQMCTEYAEASVIQENENKEQNCNFTGDDWSIDQDYHYNWCIENNDLNYNKKAVDKYSTRQEELKKCKDKNFCKEYAKKAEEQNEKNKQDGCGFTDPVLWLSNFEYHYDWCLSGQNIGIADKRTKERNTLLAKCASIKPLDGTFKIISVKPSIDENGILGRVEIIIESDSSQDWVLGDFGHNVYGSLWIEIKTINKVWYNGLVQDVVYNNFFSIRGMAAGTQSLVQPPIGNQYLKGKRPVVLIVHPFPNIRLSAIQKIFSVPVGPFEPGKLGCWHDYPEIIAKVNVFTTSGIQHDTMPIEAINTPLTTISIKQPSGGVWYHKCK